MLVRLLPVAAVLCCALAACSGGSSPSYPTSAPPSSSPSTPPTSSSPTPSPTASTTPPSSSATPVPLDQIPPGNPKTWVPAGVSTNAPYKEPGDVLPKFNQAMFKHDQNGAVAALAYYRQALNWILATNSGVATTVVCDDQSCQRGASAVNSLAGQQKHVVGQRAKFNGLSVARSNIASRGEWLAQYTLVAASGKVVTAAGATVQSIEGVTQSVDVYLRWNGKRWVVGGDYLAGS